METAQPAPTGRRLFLETLGCAKNQVDSEVMLQALRSSGWTPVGDPEQADLILVNSCGFIEAAKQESIDVTLSLAEANPQARIVMAGCLSQRYAGELAAEMPELAGLYGNRSPARIPEFLARIQEESAPRQAPLVWLPESEFVGGPRGELLGFPGSAYVKVSEGCDNRCSFCAIPLIRGRMRSKPLGVVLEEIDVLLASGAREINLVAQDLASYGRDHAVRAAAATGRPTPETAGVRLLREISRRAGQFWVRLLYVYPDRFPPEFLEIVAADPRIVPYFDIPLQHADATVLRRMGRPGSAERYLALLANIRSALPDVFIRSTFLVGFLGEDERAFEALLEFQEQARIDWLGVFEYSPEEGTPAMRGNPQPEVSPELAAARAALLRERQEKITWASVDRLVGRELDVLVEERIPDEPLALGRCYAQAPEVDGAVVIHTGEQTATPGEFLRCRIVRRNGLDVEARPL